MHGSVDRAIGKLGPHYKIRRDATDSWWKQNQELDPTQGFASTSSPLPPNDIKVGTGDLATTAAMDDVDSLKSSEDERTAEVTALRRQLDDALVRLSDSQAEVTTRKEVSK